MGGSQGLNQTFKIIVWHDCLHQVTMRRNVGPVELLLSVPLPLLVFVVVLFIEVGRLMER